MTEAMRAGGASITVSSRIGSWWCRAPSLTVCSGRPVCRSLWLPSITPTPETTLWMTLLPLPQTQGSTAEK